MFRCDLQDGEIRLGVAADQAGIQISPVDHGHFNLVRSIDDMEICENVTTGADNDTRAQPRFGLTVGFRAFAKKVPENRVVDQWVARHSDLLRGEDMYDGRQRFPGGITVGTRADERFASG